jgi:hypothetical protein
LVKGYARILVDLVHSPWAGSALKLNQLESEHACFYRFHFSTTFNTHCYLFEVNNALTGKTISLGNNIPEYRDASPTLLAKQ